MTDTQREAFEKIAQAKGYDTLSRSGQGYNSKRTQHFYRGYQAALAQKPRDEDIEDALEAAHRIKQWCDAYPEDVFIPPTPEQWKQAHKYFKEQWGFSIDKISGEYGRRWAQGQRKNVEAIIAALEQFTPQPTISESELAEFIATVYNRPEFAMHTDGCTELAQAILARFPQIKEGV